MTLVNFLIWRVALNWVLWIPKSLVQVFSETPSPVTSVHTQVELHMFYTHHSAIIINCVTYNVVQSMKHYHSPDKYNLLNNFSKQNIVYERNQYNLCFTRDILPYLTKGINWSHLFSISSTIWRQNENHFPLLHTSRFSLQFYMIDVAFLYTQSIIKGKGWHCQKILRLHHWIACSISYVLSS